MGVVFWRFRGDVIFGFCISVQEKYIIIGIGVQLFPAHQLDYPKNGDFIVDEKYTFEVGGRGKTNKQIKDVSNAYIVSDDIEIGGGGI